MTGVQTCALPIWSLSFEGYDGGDILQFPAFDLAPGESRVYRYMARMTAEDREAVDAAVKAGQLSGETVRNTAVAVCPASGGELEFSASARATYGGPESKHVESFSHVYEAEAFQVTFTVNGDAQLPVGMSLNLEGLSGLLHAKHNPTAGGIGKRADGLPYILRQFGLRGLDLEIFPFYVA